MAINITSLIIKSEDFIIGKRTYTARYTKELDDKYSEMMLKAGNLLHNLDNMDDLDDWPFDEQQKIVRDSYDEMLAISKDYLASAIGQKESDEIVRYADNRAVTITKIAQAIFEAGQSNELREKYGTNRKQRRGNGNK